MLPPTQYMVLNMEQVVPAMTTGPLSFSTYTAVVTIPRTAGN